MKKFLSLAAAAVIAACGGGGRSVRPGAGGDDTPPWVSQGSGAFNVESGRKLAGVGQSRSSDPKVRRQSADSGAQRQLQGSVDALAASLAKLSESTRQNAGDEIRAIAVKAAQATPHARDHWVTNDGVEIALDQIDLAAFKQALQSVDGDDNLKREMANNADRAFDRLAKQ
jgi:hypothetical protein